VLLVTVRVSTPDITMQSGPTIRLNIDRMDAKAPSAEMKDLDRTQSQDSASVVEQGAVTALTSRDERALVRKIDLRYVCAIPSNLSKSVTNCFEV
jgi:hypothetical protein